MTVEKVTKKSIIKNTGIRGKNPNTSSRPQGSDSQYILYLFQRENPLHIPETCAGGSFFYFQQIFDHKTVRKLWTLPISESKS